MSRLKDDMRIFIDEAKIQEMIARLAREIERDYAGQEVVLVCPLKGSVLFLADLMRQLKLPQTVDFVHLSSDKRGNIQIFKDLGVSIRNKNVIIVEEIIDAGRTLSFLKERIRASQPATLKVVALLDKPARRELPIRPDYIGMTIDDRYLVGYGMDSEETGRNYKDIYSFTM